MTLTNNLKQQVDLPVWEWCRFCPLATNAISSLTTAKISPQRYMYFQSSGTLYRYDTWSDSWHQLASVANTTPTIMNANAYSSAVGHYGRAISAGPGNNTIELAGLSGNTLVGYKIRIQSGKGAGQERTITAVSAPVIADRGVVTTAGSSSIVDASVGIGLKQWRMNAWRDYQIRCDFGTGRTQMKQILYNNANSIIWSDALQLTSNPWGSNLTPIAMNATAGTQSLYTIESNIVTVDTNWTVTPDNTSKFCVLGGGIWNITQGTTSSPFFCLQYYDVLADQWYGKSTQSGLKTAVFLAASDLALEVMTEVNGAVVGTTAVASATARSVTTAATLIPMQYANLELRIVSGTGIGQTRTIISNTVNKFNLVRDWDVTPDATSSYQVYRDVGKLWLMGGFDAGLLQYSQDSDQWSTGKQVDNGVVATMSAQRVGQINRSLTSVARTATSIVSINPVPVTAGTNYNIDDILTLGTGAGGTVRVSGVDAVGGVTSFVLETVGTGYTVGAKTTTVVPALGTGCTLNITAVDFSELATTDINHDFKLGDVVVITGAISTGAAGFNGTRTIVGVPSTTQFSYISGGDPGAATATFNANSTTVLVDSSKNWAVNEHVGKIVQISNNVLLSTLAISRRIISNTATTLTWTLAMPASTPANGVYRYIIEDVKPFGTDRTPMGIIGGGTEGFATGGSTTTLVDSTKNWQINYWARNVGRMVRITEGTGVGNEIPIISNTATTLTFATQSFTPDATTRYLIMDTMGTVSGAGGILTIATAPTAGGATYAVGDILAVTGGTAQVQVMAVAAGVVSALRLITGGVAGYTVVTGVATTPITGTGAGCTVNVTAITAVASTSVFYDNTKNWGVNQFAGKRVRFLTGTAQGNEYAIVSNTANSITTAVGTAPDVSTVYAILEAQPKAYGIHLDAITNSSNTSLNSKYMYAFSGTATPEISRYDMTAEHWDLFTYFPQTETLTTGSMYVYDGKDRIYFTKESTGRIMYYDLIKNIVVPFTTIPYGHSTAVSGNRMEIITTADGLNYLYVMRHSAQEMWRTLIFF